MKNIFTRLFLMQSIIGVYLRMILLTFMKELKLLSCEKMEVTMQDLKPRIHENGMDYVLVGDYYVPDLKLPEEHRPNLS